MKKLCFVILFILMLTLTVSCNGSKSTDNITTGESTGESTSEISSTAQTTAEITTTVDKQTVAEPTTEVGSQETDSQAEPVQTTDSQESDSQTEPEQTTDSQTESEPLPDGMVVGGDVTVISYNLDADLSTVRKRATGMCEILLSYNPDSIGVQEARPMWVKYLERGLENYDHIGVSADGEKPSETTFGTYIFYRKDKWRVIDSGTFWLSKTPDIPSIYSNTVDCNRTCCWVILENLETGFRYVHMNSHLDWMDERATLYQIKLIQKQLLIFAQMGLPVFATGDYNTDEGTDVYKAMLASDKVGDTKFLAAQSMDIGTYPHYDDYDVTTQKPIDFCFVTKDAINVVEYRVMDDKYNGEYVSDHFGLCIHASVGRLEDTYKDADTPDFSGAALSATATDSTVTLSFGAATGTTPIKYYKVTLTQKDGTPVSEKQIPSGYLKPVPDTAFDVMFSELTQLSSYEVSVTAVNLYGKESAAAQKTFTTKETVKTSVLDKPDIFELNLDGGTWSDSSAMANKITVIGKPEIITDKGGDAAISFHGGNGNLKVPGIATVYSKIKKSFTIELDLCVNSLDGTFRSLVSNMHAGGFGFDITEQNKLEFAVFADGSYKEILCDIQAGIRYHVVGTYDGNKLYLYINGNLVGSREIGNNIGLPTEKGAEYLCIGADSDMTGVGEYPAEAYIYGLNFYSAYANADDVHTLFTRAFRI